MTSQIRAFDDRMTFDVNPRPTLVDCGLDDDINCGFLKDFAQTEKAEINFYLSFNSKYF